MKKNMVFVYFLLIIGNVFSQNYFRGIIVDSLSREAVPYCNVYIKGIEGSVSNKKGQCLLNLRGTSGKSEIVISNILYHEKIISVKALLNNVYGDTILLSPKVYMLPEVSVQKGKCKEVEKGVRKVRFLTSRNMVFRPIKKFQEQFAVYIENTFSKRKQVRLKSVKYNIIDSSATGFLFKVHIYAVDDNEFIPGKELLLDNVIGRHPKTKGWIEIDLSEYNIKMPAKGLFVGIEFLDYLIPKKISLAFNKSSKKANVSREISTIYQEDLENLNYYTSWLMLQGTEYKHRKNLTWVYGISKGWIRNVPTSENSVTDNACISAKFSVCK